MTIETDSKSDNGLQKKSFIDKMLSTSIEVFVASVLFIVVFFVILIQIFSREFANIIYLTGIPIEFGPPIWTEEIARWCWVWIVFIMLGALEKIDGHLKVTFLSDKMSKRLHSIVTIILDVIYLLTSALVFKLAIEYLIRNISTSPVTLPFTNFWLYVSLPIGLAFVLVRVFFRVLFLIKKLSSNE